MSPFAVPRRAFDYSQVSCCRTLSNLQKLSSYSSAAATPRENNQDHLRSVGWVANCTQLCLFNVLVPVKHHKIRTALAAGCL